MNRKSLPVLLIVLMVMVVLGADQRSRHPSVRAEGGALEPRAYLPLVLVPALEPSFAAAPTSGMVPLVTSFSNQSSGGYTTSLWDFGDGGTSTLKNPSHIYSSAGVYSVTLTISRGELSASLIRGSYITITSPLRNGSFEEGWVDLPPVGTLINQRPVQWSLSWVEPGTPLYDSGDVVAGGVPECVHKHSTQLPPNEQLGAPEALILEGEYTYKMFHANQPFGAQLVQTISGLSPGSAWRLTAPILADLHPNKDPLTDPYTVESGVWVNGKGGWADASEMGHRNWYNHTVNFSVPSNGKVTVVIRVKSKWAYPKDFFIDAVRVQWLATGDPADMLPMGQP
jgi:PKD repeat protein